MRIVSLGCKVERDLESFFIYLAIYLTENAADKGDTGKFLKFPVA